MSARVELTSVDVRVEIPLCEQDYDLYAKIKPGTKHSTSIISVSSSYMGSNTIEPYTHDITVNNHILARGELPAHQVYQCDDLKTEYYESFIALRRGSTISINGISRSYGNITKYQVGSNGVLVVEVDNKTVVLPGKTLQGRLVDLSPDGRLLLLQRMDNLVLIDTTSYQEVKSYDPCVAASLAGNTIAIAYPDYVLVNDTRIEIVGCKLLATSPDGCVAIVTDNYLLLWNNRIIFERTLTGITQVRCNNNIVAVVVTGVPHVITDSRITTLSQACDDVLFTTNKMLWVSDKNNVTRYTLVGQPTPNVSPSTSEVLPSIVNGEFAIIGPNYLGIRSSVRLNDVEVSDVTFTTSTIVIYNM